MLILPFITLLSMDYQKFVIIGCMRYRNELLFVTSLVLNFIIMTHTHESPVPIDISAIGCYISVCIINHSLFIVFTYLN